MNCLKYHENAKTKYLYDNIFEKGVIRSSLTYNTSARHERHECDTSDTSETQVRH